MTIEEKRREVFEPIAKGFHMEMERWGDGYYFVDTQNAWEIFNAALDAVEIELPDRFYEAHGGEWRFLRDNPNPGENAKWYDYILYDETIKAIESIGLGLKVKP